MYPTGFSSLSSGPFVSHRALVILHQVILLFHNVLVSLGRSSSLSADPPLPLQVPAPPIRSPNASVRILITLASRA